MEPVLGPIDLLKTFRGFFVRVYRQRRHRSGVILRFLLLRYASLVDILLHIVGAYWPFAVVSGGHDPSVNINR